jgi:probable HAF family extracellular repeat protein
LHDDGLGGTSYASGINNEGHVVGFYTSKEGDDRAFLYSEKRMRDLTGLIKDPGSLVARYARMINDRGWVVGVGSRGNDPRPRPFVARPI